MSIPTAPPADRTRRAVRAPAGLAAPARLRLDGDDVNIEAFSPASGTLREHLASSCPCCSWTPAERLIGQYLIDMVNEGGYLRRSREIAERLGTAASMSRRCSQSAGLRSAGVLARDLWPNVWRCNSRTRTARSGDERLARQSRLLARRDNFAALRKAVRRRCRRSHGDDRRDQAAQSQAGPGFGAEPVQPVVPDVFVRAAPDGVAHRAQQRHAAARADQPSLLRDGLEDGARDKDEDLPPECLENANWLVKSLDQRARTILRSRAKSCASRTAFSLRRRSYLRPLNLSTVADAIEMHESTVSRVTSNKYMATPRGMFELKYFFTSAIASAEARRSAFGRGGAPPHQAS